MSIFCAKAPAVNRNRATMTLIWLNLSQIPACEDRMRTMKTTLNILGALLVLFGAIWILQGINILPGSFMTGQIQWAVYGAIAAAAGIALLLVARRRR